MVRFTTLVVGLTLATSVLGAVVVPEDDEFADLAATSNSYAEWAEKISAAVEQAEDAGANITSRSIPNAEEDTGADSYLDGDVPARLFKRTCDSRPGGTHPPASTADAARCVSALARRGRKRCTASVSATEFVRHGYAHIVGVAGCVNGVCKDRHATCNRIAIAAGHIMDHCSHDGITGGQRVIKKKHINVILAGL